MDDWLQALMELRLEEDAISRRWPKATRYVLEHHPQTGPVLRGEGPLVQVDIQPLDIARELAAVQGRDRLLRTVNLIGLTAPWENAPDGIGFNPKLPRKRPGWTMTLMDFERDVRDVRSMLEAFNVGFAQVWDGRRLTTDAVASLGQRRFMEAAWKLGQAAHSELLHWAPTAIAYASRGGIELSSGYGWTGLRPPTLKELALGQILSAAQEHEPVRECPQCHELFLRPQRRKGSKGAYTRKDVRFCSQSCAQKHWYEANKKGRA